MDRQQVIDSLPLGLERCVGRIIVQRVGQEAAISKQELINLVAIHGYRGRNMGRKVRAVVHELRKKGALICTSSSGKGFWWAANHAETEAFIGELRGRALDMLDTAKEMEQAADEKYVQQPMRMF